MNKLIEQFRKIDEKIVSKDLTKLRDHELNDMNIKLHNILRDVLRIKLSYIDDIFYNDSLSKKSDKNIEIFIQNVQISIKIIKENRSIRKKKSINNLTFISTICLPLGLIFSFFGMNFGFMGIDPGTKGMLRSKYSQMYLILLITVTIVYVNIAFKLQIF